MQYLAPYLEKNYNLDHLSCSGPHIYGPLRSYPLSTAIYLNQIQEVVSNIAEHNSTVGVLSENKSKNISFHLQYPSMLLIGGIFII